MQVKSEAILKVINNFKSVLPKAKWKNHLDMGQGGVNVKHICGTVHCHGGWYAIATCNLRMLLDYSDGVKNMCIDLGFFSANGLKDWAENNPLLWGNEFGYMMFSNEYSFFNAEKRPSGATNLSDIIDHWTDVYERVKALENSWVGALSVKPIYPDITKQLAVSPVEETSDKPLTHVANS